MPISDARFGADLRLLPRPLPIPLRGNSHSPGNDLRTAAAPGHTVDLDTIEGVSNLEQALMLRFLTPVGELAILGHPDYGSRLFELIGELNNDTNRNRAKLFILLALAAEPRVKEVLSVQVTQNRSDRTRMDIAVSLLAIDSDTPLNLVFPFSLAGGVTP